jgi:OFA family oxalate/formate antiporter-like MFS transporter
VEGYLVDRFGPRWVIMGGSILVAGSWALNSVASSLTELYVGAVLGGIGTGCVYGTCVGNALKWLPGRRGLAAGITAMGFGVGSAFTVSPLKSMIQTSGYEHTFLFFGIVQGGIVFVMSWLLQVPPSRLAKSAVKANQTAHGYSPREVLRNPCFYVLYAMFVLIAAGGLTMAASIVSIAADFKISEVPVALFGFVAPAAVFAVQLNRIFDGIGRPAFGWLADQIGREYTMALAFLVGAGALFALHRVGGNATAFVLITTIYFGVYGEIFSLFPATSGDTFGAKYAAANAGMLYTAKGVGAVLVPVAAWISGSYGWGAVFSVAMTLNIIAGLTALFVLRPLRLRHFANSRMEIATARSA